MEKKNEETSGIIFNHPVTDSRTGFSWRKNHDPDQKAGAEDNKHFFKESCTKIKGRNKKRANRLSKRARARNRRFCEIPKSKSRIRSG